MIKIYYRVELTCKSPLAISSGLNKNSDSDLNRRKNGNCFISGTAMAGIFNHLSQREKGEMFTKSLFGYIEGEKQIQQSSRVLFYDFDLFEERKVAIRDSVSLENKVAKKGAKFDMEVLETGSKFVGFIEVNSPSSEEIAFIEKTFSSFNSGMLRMGKKSTRGYGEFSVSAKKATFELPNKDWLDFDMYDSLKYSETITINDKHVEGFKVTINLKQIGGISIRKYSTKPGEPDFVTLSLDDNTPVIPGTSWAGAFRERFLEFSCKELTERVFGYISENKQQKSKIIFSESKLKDGNWIEMTRTSLDRFTSGTKDGALFTEKTYYNGKTSLSIILPADDDTKNALCTLAMVTMDLHEGLLAIGGLTSIGRGVFEVEKAIINSGIDSLDVTTIIHEHDMNKFMEECENVIESKRIE